VGATVVVLGSGAAGLAAALGARAAGAETVVLEREPLVGGTTAMSGGVVWVPGNHLLDADERADDALGAATYLRGLDPAGVDGALVDVFAADAGRVAMLLQNTTPVRWEPLPTWPDYRCEVAGARAGGRSIWPDVASLAPEVAARVQGSPDDPFGVTPSAPSSSAPGGAAPGALDTSPTPRPIVASGRSPESDAVVLRGPVRGRALVGSLLAGLLGTGVEVRTGVRTTALLCRDGTVDGVVADGERIEGRVVIASGGFQHDAALAARHLGPLPVAPMGVPGCVGDGLRLAEAAGAALGTMTEGWWMPAIAIPGERFDGRPLYRPLHGERAQPGSLMVDGRGKRFVDEAANYGDVGAAMRARALSDAGAARTWLVFGRAYRDRYPVGPLRPGDPDPPWLRRGEDLDELAGSIGVAGTGLTATVARFDAHAACHRDPDFGRGDGGYDRWIGDPRAPHPTLGPLGSGPYFAVEVRLGCMGTKGGPRTDDEGRVASRSGVAPISGLYAAGNAAASPFGSATPAGGGTLGPALVFGWRAGHAAATDR
jgi:3-oxosteroid 1-dehydrogenase